MTMRWRYTTIVSLAVGIAPLGCALFTSFDAFDTTGGPSFRIGGRVEGLESGAHIEVVLNGRTPGLRVGNEAFRFNEGLREGETYDVTVRETEHHGCAVERGTGVVRGAVTDVSIRCAADASLVDLEVSPGTLSEPFRPDLFAYDAGVVRTALLGPPRGVVVTAVARSARATMTFAGAPLVSGVPSAPFPLPHGASTLSIAVETPDGAPRALTYSIAIRGQGFDYVKASNTRSFAVFGTAVAFGGDTFVVGSPGEASAASGVDANQADTTAPSAGAVYVFRRSAETWVQEAYLKASNTRAHANFGTAVALDRDTLVVGAVGDTSRGIPGAVYVFRRGGATWSEEALLQASRPRSEAQFGYSVAVRGDDAVVGAPGESSNAVGIGGDESNTSATDSGAVYTFVRSGTAWTQRAYVKAQAVEPGARFGHAVAIDGGTLAIGAPFSPSAPSRGAVSVYTRASSTDSWTFATRLASSTTSDALGFSLALSGTTLVAGAMLTSSAGAAYVFEGAGSSFTETAKLQPASPSTYFARFGISVALFGDSIAVGADSDSSGSALVDGDAKDTSRGESGAAYLFRRSSGAWGRVAYVKSPIPRANTHFGSSVALTSDGALISGARYERSRASGIGGDFNDESASMAGAVFVYY